MKQRKLIIAFIVVFLLILLFMPISAKAYTAVTCSRDNSKAPNPSGANLGLRNNNPLNIRISNTQWLGKIPLSQNTDCAFEQFESKEYGTRAAMINLRSYINRYGRNTIEKIIYKWAPPSENDTLKYIEDVSSWTGITKDTVISFEENTIKKLVRAMSRKETGVQVSNSVLNAAWNMI